VKGGSKKEEVRKPRPLNMTESLRIAGPGVSADRRSLAERDREIGIGRLRNFAQDSAATPLQRLARIELQRRDRRRRQLPLL
jgi:hypothetical protein